MMKAGLAVLLGVVLFLLAPPTALGGCDDQKCKDADWKIAKNVTHQSSIFLIGYMNEMGVYQTERGAAGSKLAYSVSGSGTASKTMTVYVDEGGSCGGNCGGDGGGSGIYLNIQAEYNYHPYTFVPETTTYGREAESHLRSALRAKNRVVGTEIAERSPGADYLLAEEAAPQQRPALEVLRLGSW